MWATTWQLKISKRCNLRCRYCYEWNDLARPERFTPTQWNATLRAIALTHRREVARTGEPGRTFIAWHGGEPLLLPASYARAVLAMEREVLGVQALGAREYVNAVQTSLYTLTDEWLDLLVEGGFEVGASLDLVPGVRLTAGGRQTERRVIANLDRLAARGVPVVGTVVLAGHTEGQLEEIHDFFAERDLPFQVNLLLPSPVLGPRGPLSLPWDRAAAALERLYLHWMEDTCRVAVYPLAGYLATVLLGRMCLERMPAPTDPWTGRLVVDTGGEVYRAGNRGVADRSLGNVFREPIEQLVDGDGGWSALADERVRRDRHCPTCDYRRWCDGSPVLEAPRSYATGPCPVAARVMAFIDREVEPEAYQPRETPWSAGWISSDLGLLGGITT